MRATRTPNFLQVWIINALEWCESSNVSVTLAAVLAFLVVLIGMLAAYQQ